MSTKYLGENFDIHGGGLDLKFPHHECEVAQGTACNGVNPVNYWLHANMLTMNGLRMSKSTGNYILPLELLDGKNDFFEKEFSPSVVRFCFMQAHYRGVLDISNEAMVASEKGYNRLMEAMDVLSKIEVSNSSSVDIAAWKDTCYTAMNDDFNTTILMAQLFEAVRIINGLNDKKETISETDLTEFKNTLDIFVFDVLGLTNKKAAGNNNKLGSVIEMLIEMRMEARANKNWALSDEIRDKLAVLDIQLKDGKEGTSFTL
jgi:cysteinyl-tRNA synthetase